jgi:predicted metal-dependent peptidase
MFRQEVRLLQKIGSPFCFTSRSTEVKLIFNPLNAELNPIRHLLAFLGAHHILHVSRLKVRINTALSDDAQTNDTTADRNKI